MKRVVTKIYDSWPNTELNICFPSRRMLSSSPNFLRISCVGTDPDIAGDDRRNSKQANVHNTWPAEMGRLDVENEIDWSSTSAWRWHVLRVKAGAFVRTGFHHPLLGEQAFCPRKTNATPFSCFPQCCSRYYQMVNNNEQHGPGLPQTGLRTTLPSDIWVGMQEFLAIIVCIVNVV